MLKNIWRYSVNEGDAGGIVIAENKNEAYRKIFNKYKDFNGNEKAEITVWKATDDDYYDKDYEDVLECYGL